uniref:Putative secreted protein n=1 Tax=Ixodes ricinus TaxID=34613 RepID=A0A6B0UG47_IXORI
MLKWVRLILARLSGSRCASVVNTNWSKSNRMSSGDANSRYRYLKVSASTNESILSSCLPVRTSLTAANPQGTLACFCRESTTRRPASR